MPAPGLFIHWASLNIKKCQSAGTVPAGSVFAMDLTRSPSSNRELGAALHGTVIRKATVRMIAVMFLMCQV